MKRIYVRNDLKKGIKIPQKHRRNSAQRFPKRRLVARLCPLCGKSLAIYTNSKTQKEFIGCSGYPSSCKFIEWKSVVDYACENIGIGIGWRPEIDRGAINILEKIKRQSMQEVNYLIGAAYFLNHLGEDHKGPSISLYATSIRYNDKMLKGIGFLDPFVFWGGGSAPSALAFVPQLPFGNKLHHDFGLFSSVEHSAKPSDWEMVLAIEIDIYPTHQLDPGLDEFRDSLVSYKVVRLRPETDTPLNWFVKFKNYWDSK